MRLDKFLKNLKIGSRKDVKKIIKNGSIKVNNIQIKDDGYKLKKDDIVTYLDNVLEYKEFVYYLLNKPSGYVSATVDNLYPTVISLIDDYHDLFPVGRLDVDTTGLLLITNDGDLAHKLTSPKYHVDKKYYVEFRGLYHDDNSDLQNENYFVVLTPRARYYASPVWSALDFLSRTVLTIILEKAQPPVKLPSSLPSGQEITGGPLQVTPTFIFMLHRLLRLL